MLSSLRSGARSLGAGSKGGVATSVFFCFHLVSLSVCLAVHWVSALACPLQGSWSVGDRQLQNSNLFNLRNFTTEQRGTTVLCVRKQNKVDMCSHQVTMVLQRLHALHVDACDMQVVIMADGQVTRGNEIVKPNVTKVRRLNDSVISGFAGDL